VLYGAQIGRDWAVAGVPESVNKILFLLWLKNIPHRLTIEADMSRICVPFKEGEAVRCLTKT